MTTIVLIAVSVSLLSLIASILISIREIRVKRSIDGLARQALESSEALEQQIADVLISYGIEPEKSDKSILVEHVLTSLVWELSRSKVLDHVQLRDASFTAKWHEVAKWHEAEAEVFEPALTWRKIVLPRKSSTIREVEHSKYPMAPGFRDLVAA